MALEHSSSPAELAGAKCWNDLTPAIQPALDRWVPRGVVQDLCRLGDQWH